MDERRGGGPGLRPPRGSGRVPRAGCFHAQQAAEKAVKAVHYLRGARAVLGHSVRALMESLEPREGALEDLVDAARDLDLLYLPTRCPNGLEAGTPGAAFSAAQSARAIELSVRMVEAARGLVGS